MFSHSSEAMQWHGLRGACGRLGRRSSSPRKRFGWQTTGADSQASVQFQEARLGGHRLAAETGAALACAPHARPRHHAHHLPPAAAPPHGHQLVLVTG